MPKRLGNRQLFPVFEKKINYLLSTKLLFIFAPSLRANTVVLFGLTINLRLPDCVGRAPQPRQDVEDVAAVGVRLPREHHGEDGRVDDGAGHEDGDAAGYLHEGAEAQREGRVAHAVRDQHEAHVVHAVSA